MNRRTKQISLLTLLTRRRNSLQKVLIVHFSDALISNLRRLSFCVHVRALKLLASLDESKATGPDHIPASILKRIAKEICVPFTILCRRLLQEACWPQIWRLHVICPLYKRGSAFMSGNYRGIHLTAILAKTAERFIARDLIAFLHTGKIAPE